MATFTGRRHGGCRPEVQGKYVLKCCYYKKTEKCENMYQKIQEKCDNCMLKVLEKCDFMLLR